MPLVLPSANNPYVMTVCGFDPGTNHLGFSKLEVDCRNKAIVSVWADTVHVEKLSEPDGFLVDSHTELAEKLYKLYTTTLRLLTWARPNYVASESPFYNRLRPTAYGPLTKVMQSLEMAVIHYSPIVPFTTVEPSLIKKSIGAGHISGKDMVREAVYKHPELNSVCLVDMQQLDEHAIDAIAVAYTHLKLHL